jgi:hypothetical protein
MQMKVISDVTVGFSLNRIKKSNLNNLFMNEHKVQFEVVDHEPSVQKGHFRGEEGPTPSHQVRFFPFLLLPLLFELST